MPRSPTAFANSLQCALLTACLCTASAGAADLPTVKGSLVYSSGNEVRLVNLASGAQSVVYVHSAPLSSAISNVDDDTFIVSSVGSEVLLIRQGVGSVVLTHGSSPLFLPKHKLLFYYSAFPENQGPRLFASPLIGGALGERREIDPGPFRVAPPPLAISDDEVLFYRRTERENRAFLFNAREGAVRPLALVNCRPTAWVKALNQIVCTRDGAVLSFALDGTQQKEWPELKDIAIGVASPSQPLVLGSKGRLGSLGGEAFDLVLFDMSTRLIGVVARSVPLVNSTGVWLE